jgi:hypothetical protein
MSFVPPYGVNPGAAPGPVGVAYGVGGGDTSGVAAGVTPPAGLPQQALAQNAFDVAKQKIQASDGGGFLGMGLSNIAKIPGNMVSGLLRNVGEAVQAMPVMPIMESVYNGIKTGDLGAIPRGVGQREVQALENFGSTQENMTAGLGNKVSELGSSASGGTYHPPTLPMMDPTGKLTDQPAAQPFWSRPGGWGYGLVQDVSTAAMIAAPIAGGTAAIGGEGAAGVTEADSALTAAAKGGLKGLAARTFAKAAQAGAVGDTAGQADMLAQGAQLAQAAKVADAVAHPYHSAWDGLMAHAQGADTAVNTAYHTTAPGEQPMTASDQAPAGTTPMSNVGNQASGHPVPLATDRAPAFQGATEPYPTGGGVRPEKTAWTPADAQPGAGVQSPGPANHSIPRPGDDAAHANADVGHTFEGKYADSVAQRAKYVGPGAQPHVIGEPSSVFAGAPTAAVRGEGGVQGPPNAPEATQGLAGRLTDKAKAVGSLLHDVAVGPGQAPPVDVPLHTRLLAAAYHRAQMAKSRDGVLYQEIAGDANRRAINNSPAVRDSLETAKKYVLDRGLAKTPAEASEIVGDEIVSHLDTSRQFFSAYGVEDKDLVRFGIRNTELPEQLKTDPEFQAMIDAHVQQWKELFRDNEERLRATRIGDKGLVGQDQDTPFLSRGQERDLRVGIKRWETAQGMDAAAEREKLAANMQVASGYDTLGKNAEKMAANEGEMVGVGGTYDETNSLLPKLFRTASHDQRMAMYDKMIQDGYGTIDPNTGKFISTMADTDKGRYASGIVPGLQGIPVADVTPELIDAIMRRFQGLFEQSDHVTIGAWTKDGKMYIEPSEILPDNPAYAMAVAKSRTQDALYDMQTGEDIATDTGRPIHYAGLIGERPNASGTGTISNHREFDRWMGEQADAQAKLAQGGKNGRRAGENRLTPDDIAHNMDFLVTQSYEYARATGRPQDEFFSKSVLGDIKASLRDMAGPLGGERFAQTLLNLPRDPDALIKMLGDIKAAGYRVDETAKWYYKSHDYIENMYRDNAPVHLIDGTEINPADLMYQLIAVTSIQARPADNLASALTGYANIRELNAKLAGAKRVVDEYKKADASGANLRNTKLYSDMVNGEKPKRGTPGFGAVHQMNDKTAQALVFEILRGHTITPHGDWGGWDANYLRTAPGQFGNKLKPLSEKNITPDMIQHAVDNRRQYGFQGTEEELQRVGHEDAVMEYHGSTALAKLRSFHSNLSDPEHSPLVTMDSWMKRMFNNDSSGFNVTKWTEFADLMRGTADKYSAIVGRQVMPHEMQAIFWGHVKTEISRQNVGMHWADASDGLDLLHSGDWSIHNDPVLLSSEKDLRITEDERAHRIPISTNEGVPRPVDTMRSQSDDLRTVQGTTVRQKETQYFTPSARSAENLTGEQEGHAYLQGELQRVQALKDSGHPVEAEQKYISIMNERARDIRDEEWGDYSDIGMNPTKRGQAAEDRLVQFHQEFENRVLGMTDFTNTTRPLITLYEGADLTTLVHEEAHVLRRILPPEDVTTLEKAYGVPKGGTWTRDQEEKFANDTTGYLASGRASSPGLEPLLARLQENLHDTWENVRDKYWQNRNGVSVPDGVAQLWDRLLNPVERPLENTIPGFPKWDTYAKEPNLGAPRQLAKEARQDAQLRSGITPGQSYQQGVTSGRLIEKAIKLAAEHRALQLESEQVMRTTEKIKQDIIDGALPVASAQRKLYASAEAQLNRLGTSFEHPKIANVPAPWQPLYKGVLAVLEDMKTNPEMVRAFGADFEGKFSDIISKAHELGVDPVHVSNFSTQDVQRLVYQTMRLGKPNETLGKELAAKSRTTRNMTQYAVDRSVESLAAASIQVVHEERTNAVVDMVESRFVREMPAVEKGEKAPIPPGWTPWSARRSQILGRLDGAGNIVGPTGGQLIIPNSVDKVLRQYSADYSHWMPEGMKKMLSPWKAFVLTLNPRWYVHRIFGNLILSIADGVKFQDIAKAWGQYRMTPDGRFAEIPGIAHNLDPSTDVNGGRSLMHFGTKESLQMAYKENGVKGAVGAGRNALFHAHDVIDEFFRAATYDKNIRAGMAPVDAMVRAQRALADYGNLSPFERQIVGSVLPFYSFEKSMLKVAIKLPYDHPAMVPFMISMGQANRQRQQDEFGAVLPSAYSNYMKFDGTRFNLSSLNPLQNASLLTTPQGIASAMNPYLDMVVRDAYGAPKPGTAAAPHMDPTGHLVSGVDYAKALTSMGTGLPQLGALGGQTSRSSVATTAANFLGLPLVDPNAAKAIQQRTLESQAKLAEPGASLGAPQAQTTNPKPGGPPVDTTKTAGYQQYKLSSVDTPAQAATAMAATAATKAKNTARFKAQNAAYKAAHPSHARLTALLRHGAKGGGGGAKVSFKKTAGGGLHVTASKARTRGSKHARV